MAYTENIEKQKQARGIDMATMARESRNHPSLADGVTPTGLASGATAPGSPGAVLGTGSNADVYITTIEAV
jgi:hypothetical protein